MRPVLAEPLMVALRVGEVLDGLGVPWVVGGSVASSLHGVPRSTQDIDIVADLVVEHVDPFVRSLEGEFYVDVDAVMSAVRGRTSCNLIHLGTMTKIYVFAMKRDALSRSQVSRREFHQIEGGASLPMTSPEDTILQKLSWFRSGGGTSQRQWQDVLGVLRVCGKNLDMTYLNAAAARAGLKRSLDEAIAEAAAP